MTEGARKVQRTYLLLTLLSTLAASFIWGINTLFLLDAGLSNTEAFAANAFFTAGQVLFEVPTGVVADVYSRRLSILIGFILTGLGFILAGAIPRFDTLLLSRLSKNEEGYYDFSLTLKVLFSILLKSQ